MVTEGYRGVPPLPPTWSGDPVVTSVVSVTAMGESISTANVGEHRVNIGQHKDNLGQHRVNIGQDRVHVRQHRVNIEAR